MEFHRFSDEAMRNAKKVLPILELTEWRWTINDVHEQPEEELEAVFALKAIGERIKAQSKKATAEGPMETI